METLQRTANRGSISTGYEIENSLKLEEDNSEYLERATTGSGGSGTKHTISVWVKRTEITKTSFILGFANIGILRFDSADRIEYSFRSGRKLETNRLFRDTSAWYHIVVVADSSQATDTNRMRLWVNGVQETSFFFFTAQDLNQGSPAWGNYPGYNFRIGYSGNAGENFNGYIADAYYINGQTLDPTDFGEFDDDSGIWKPKAFTGTLGSLDNYLDFSNSSNLGEDANGGTDLSLNNITSADQATDTPTNNFATFNAVLPKADLREGATRFFNHDAGEDTNLSTIAVTSGKWYAEFSSPSNISGGNGRVGVSANVSGQISEDVYLGGDAWNVAVTSSTGSVGTNNSFSSYLGSGFSANDLISVALDMDNKKVYFALNGTWGNSGNPATGTNGVSLPSAYEDYEWFIGVTLVLNTDTFNSIFGGYTSFSISTPETDENGYGTFEYAPPSGYYALCTKNLAEYG